MTIEAAKRAARTLRTELGNLTHAQALEIVARQLGFRDWNTAAATLAPGTAHGTTQRAPDGTAPGAMHGHGLGHSVPVVRILDESASASFYQDFLGFTVMWDHRFEPELPLYRRIRREQTMLDLSEHHGDGTPGAVVWVPVTDLTALHAELAGKHYPRQRPGIEPDAPGGPTLSVTDPVGNVLRFCQLQQ